ncbi:hypothetical protein ACFQVC_03230 [Streptomyces monticola]|uniref:Tetratricopeptide repeat protein n=1 Tax=Streptomyces monticola TaxID=2666263 RepID=A0ABW2JB53_9ACTN
MGRRRGAYRSGGLRRPGGWRLLYWTVFGAGTVAAILALVQAWTTAAVAVGLGGASTAALGLLVEQIRSQERWPEHLSGARPGRVPRVREANDPADWVAQPAGRDNWSATPYVERDVDTELSALLRHGGFVLLLGESAAGKSRTAYEAVRRTLPAHAWVCPFTRASVAVAVEAARACTPSVLWLDDLENYLGLEGLTVSQVHHLLGQPRPAVLVATMRSEEYRRYDTHEGSRLTGADRDLWRSERAVIARATVVRVERLWSPAELRRARSLAPSRRIGIALRASDRFGIAESLSCGPELVNLWKNAWACGGQPRGAALVTAVVDCRRAGLRRPVPVEWVRRTHEGYLAARGGECLRPEPFEEAEDWACLTVRATSSLLSRSADPAGLTCFDYLLGSDGLEPVPDHLWETLLPLVQGEEAYDIGLVAHGELRLRHALVALNRAQRDQVPGADFALALVIGDSGHPRRAIDLLRAQARGRMVPLPVRLQLAHFRGVAGDYAASAHAFRGLVHEMTRTLGADHPDTLAARHEAAFYTGESGRTSEAVAELTALAAVRRQVLGADHHQTLATRRSMAWFQGKGGQLELAVRELQDLLAESRTILGARDPHTLAVRSALAQFQGEAGDWARAARELADISADRQATLGPGHPHTLATRHQLALALAHGGDREGARTLLSALLSDMTFHLAPDHPHLTATRATHAGLH